MERFFKSIDWVTTAVLVCIGAFGLFILLSIDQSLFTQQLIFFVVGIALLMVVAQIDSVLLIWFAPIGYMLGLVFLFTSYLGPNIRGAHRWIIIGTIQLQPSELMKPVFLLAFAWLIARFPPRKLRYLAFHVVLFALPFLLIFRQPDLGTGLVYAGLWLAMMMAGGLPVWIVGAAGAIGGALMPIIWRVLADFQRSRILTFLNPEGDPKGAGYNALQAMIAIGSGQLIGRGLGQGTQSHLRFLPEFHTDFIFATLVEEFGFIGGLLLLGGYGLLLWRLLSPLLRGKTIYVVTHIYAVGLLGMLLVQIFINTGMNMGILPITGITLPFVSYGGSSVLSLCVCFGVLWALSRHPANRSGLATDL